MNARSWQDQLKDKFPDPAAVKCSVGLFSLSNGDAGALTLWDERGNVAVVLITSAEVLESKSGGA